MREEHEQWEHWKATMSSYQSWERPRSHDWQHGAMTLSLANLPALLRAAGWEGQLVCRSSAAPRVLQRQPAGVLCKGSTLVVVVVAVMIMAVLMLTVMSQPSMASRS
jgi:hypothetical protein